MTSVAQTALKVACPACITVNRIDDARRGDAPKCGRCGALLLDGTPVELKPQYRRPPGHAELWGL